MRPVLFSVFGFDLQSYGVSKALAALAAAFLLSRAFERLGLKRDSAYALVMWATIWGFVGAKIYYLLEQLPTLTLHDLGGMGFTWYGGLIGGVVAALVIVRRDQLPLGVVAGAAAVPLTLAYGIGRLGCLLSGDGTYGRPTSLPWAMTFPNAVVPTEVPVHPTPLWRSAGRHRDRGGPVGGGQAPHTSYRLRRLPRAEWDLPVPRGVPAHQRTRPARADPTPALGAGQPDDRRRPHPSYQPPEPAAPRNSPGTSSRRGCDRTDG